MSVIGYIRVSSNKQTLEHQRFEIEQFVKLQGFKVDNWIEEKISSRKALKKRKLGNLLENLQENDILISCEISRLGRSLLEVMRILEICLTKNCQVWTIKENYRLGNDIQSKVLAFAFGLASEIERQLISERTKNSLQRLKDEGKHLGRPYGFSYKKLQKRHDKIKELLDKNVSKSEIARLMGCTWQTLHRYIKDSIDTYSQNRNGCNF